MKNLIIIIISVVVISSILNLKLGVNEVKVSEVKSDNSFGYKLGE